MRIREVHENGATRPGNFATLAPFFTTWELVAAQLSACLVRVASPHLQSPNASAFCLAVPCTSKPALTPYAAII